MSKADAVAQAHAWVTAGHAVGLQQTGEHITYEFLGGSYDGVKIRLYPPFSERIVLQGEVYMLGAPKNGRSKRLTYRMEGTDELLPSQLDRQ